MRILCLSSYPVEAAATRFRLEQFVGPLRKRGIEMEVRPFLDSRRFESLYQDTSFVAKAGSMVLPLLKRFRDVFAARKYDAVFVQREAMIFGPSLIEWLIANVIRRPIVLDLDDATYVRYVSPTYGRLGSAFKFFGKTDNLIRRSKLVICGNRSIAEYVDAKGTKSVVIPTVVDLEKFVPRETRSETGCLMIGWIGTHSTFPFLESLFPVMERLAKKHRFVFKIVGSGQPNVSIRGVDCEVPAWDLDREIDDFRSLDIGLYPITVSPSADPQWINGKSGFKAIQYMAVGVPFVMSPVGVCSELGDRGRTHFNAATEEDWYNFLDELLTKDDLRAEMGVAGRKFALANYGLEQWADQLGTAIRGVIVNEDTFDH